MWGNFWVVGRWKGGWNRAEGGHSGWQGSPGRWEEPVSGSYAKSKPLSLDHVAPIHAAGACGFAGTDPEQPYQTASVLLLRTKLLLLPPI